MSSTGSPRRVLVVHPGAQRYGSDRMLAETVIGLLTAGDQVVVALAGDGPLAADLRAAGAQVRIVASPVLRKSALRPAGFVRMVRDALAAAGPSLRLLGGRPDVVYVSTLTIPLWVILARLTRRRVIVHVHESERTGSRALGIALTAPLLLAQRVLVNSRFSTEVLLESLPRLAGRCQVVLNGVEGPPAVVAARRRLTDGLRVLYVGRLSPRKGPDVLLAAARELRRDRVPVQVRLAGDVFAGYEWFETQLRTEYAAEIADASVQLRGFRDDIWPELAWADVAVVPSVLPEPFGNTAVEAALAGRPVVVSEIGGLPEAIAGSAAATTVPPGEPATLALTLAKLYRDWPDAAVRAGAQVEATRLRFAPARYRAEVVAAVHELADGSDHAGR